MIKQLEFSFMDEVYAEERKMARREGILEGLKCMSYNIIIGGAIMGAAYILAECIKYLTKIQN